MCHLFRYFDSSTKLLISSTKLFATGNLARDGLIKVVSVYCGICTLYYLYRSYTDTTGIGPPLISVAHKNDVTNYIHSNTGHQQ